MWRGPYFIIVFLNICFEFSKLRDYFLTLWAYPMCQRRVPKAWRQVSHGQTLLLSWAACCPPHQHCWHEHCTLSRGTPQVLHVRLWRPNEAQSHHFLSLKVIVAKRKNRRILKTDQPHNRTRTCVGWAKPQRKSLQVTLGYQRTFFFVAISLSFNISLHLKESTSLLQNTQKQMIGKLV